MTLSQDPGSGMEGRMDAVSVLWESCEDDAELRYLVLRFSQLGSLRRHRIKGAPPRPCTRYTAHDASWNTSEVCVRIVIAVARRAYMFCSAKRKLGETGFAVPRGLP